MRLKFKVSLLCGFWTLWIAPAFAGGQSIQQLVSAIHPAPTWKGITIDRAGRDSLGFVVELTIRYKSAPYETDVMGETDFVARKILSWIVTNHKADGNTVISVAVCGLLVDVKGITGKNLAASLGCTTYNPNSDGLEWHPDMGKPWF